jgi:hypothetical protein
MTPKLKEKVTTYQQQQLHRRLDEKGRYIDMHVVFPKEHP